MHTASVAVHTGASVAAVVVAICILQFVALLRNPIGVVAVGVVAVVAAVAAAVVDFDPVVGCTTTRVGAASYRFPPRRSSSRQSAARSLYYSLVPIDPLLSMLVASIHYYRPITHNNRRGINNQQHRTFNFLEFKRK